MPSRRLSRRLARPVVLVPVAAIVVAGVAVPTTLAATGGSMSATGLKNGAVLDKADIAGAALRVKPNGVNAASLKATLDGAPVPLAKDGAYYVVKPGALPDGKHTLSVRADKQMFGSASVTRDFTVDTTPPTLSVALPTKPVQITDPVTVSGQLEKGATVTAKGGALKVDGTSFTLHYKRPPAGAQVVATDAAGNTTVKDVTVPTRYPQNIRAVHMTGAAWAYPKLHDPVIQMIKEHRINAVQLDIKDEDGIINYQSKVPLAQQAGATAKYYDPKKVTDQLHAMGIRVIGRLVAFNDPKLADFAVAHGHPDWVVQNPDGSKYLYGSSKHGFTDFANPAVRTYNEDIAVEAVKAGFDDVVYDYVRRPDGKISGMRFPGLVGNPEDAIVTFLKESQAKLRPLGGSLGAAAFAQAATRPASTAQNIPKMAKYLDVVIPMDYPSHWNNGEYGVPDVYAGAYDIVYRSLKDWIKDVQGTNCVVVPWLQDENFRGTYDEAKVRQEIKGARDNGIPGWLMWSAVSKFTPAAYDPDATSAL